MDEKIEKLYDELFNYLQVLIESRTTSGIVPDVARVLIELIILQLKM